MTSVPYVFDRKLMKQRRARIAAQAQNADFLHEAVAHDIADRLALIKRSFAIAADLGAHTGRVGHALKSLGSVHTLFEADSCAAMITGRPGNVLIADEELVPFAPQSLDLVCSSLALHFVNDLPGTLSQIFRSLRPDGLFIGALFGVGTLGELGAAFLQAESEVTGSVSPRIAPLPDVRDMGVLLQRAGFTLPVSDVDTITVRYDSPIKLMQDLRLMGMTNILSERSLKPLRRAVLTRLCEIYGEQYADPDGRIRATFEIIHIAGWHPHESQQKPLAPGSAAISLTEILGSKNPRAE